MDKLIILMSILISVNECFSQDVYKTLLEGTYWGQPFELRQVTLSEEDACNPVSYTHLTLPTS